MKLLMLATSYLLTIVGSAQINVSPGNTITQNFDAMGSSLTLPANWKMGVSTSSPTWAAASSSVTQQASSGGPTTGGTYNWGNGATERAVGAMSTGTFASPNNLLSFFVNSGTTNITGFTISYDAERYRINSAAASVQFYYSLNGSVWVNVSSGDIAAASFPTGSNVYTLATPLVINRPGISVTGLIITPGSNFYLRWNINTTGGNSQGIGIDNIVVTANGDIPPAALIAGTIAGFGNVCVGAHSTANSFTLSGTNLDGSQVTVGPLGNYSLSGTAGGPWTATLSPFYTGSSFSTIIYVRLTPASIQSYDGNIPLSGGNANSINLAVSGAGINTVPATASGVASSVTQTSATINGVITDGGCGSITGYGIEYSATGGFGNGTGTAVASVNLNNGNFSSLITSITAGTTYYYHAYAANSGGTSYGTEQSFTTLPPDPITAIAATGVTASGFTANWNPVFGAVDYKLDVATTTTFLFPGNEILANWNFPNLNDDAIVDNASLLNVSKTISAINANMPVFNVFGATTSAAKVTGWDNGNANKYWQIEMNTIGYYNLFLSSKQRSSATGPKDFKAQYRVGATGTWTDIPAATITVADNFTSGVLINKALPAECYNQPSVFIRWIMTSNQQVSSGTVGSTGSSLIDDIVITGNLTSCLPGYENLLVNDISQPVTGLIANTTYHYRVRAFDGNSTTINSNVITVTTSAQAILPVNLISFSGTHNDGKNKLRWVTATERNNLGFEVQRSNDGVNYQSIYFQRPYFSDGNSDEKLTYAHNDYSYTGERQYYRLRQVDIDGRAKFSNVILIVQEKPELLSLAVLPDIVTTEMKVIIRSPQARSVNMVIANLTGAIVLSKKQQVNEGLTILPYNVYFLPAGSYYVSIRTSEGSVETVKFIKQ